VESPQPEYVLNLKADEALREVRINGQPVAFEGRTLRHVLPLNPGENTVVINATDAAGNTAKETLSIRYRTLPEGLDKIPGRSVYRWRRDDSLMVRVPRGRFVMGTTKRPEESPPHRVELSGYFLDVYEVTNRQYQRFLDAVKDRPLDTVNHPDAPDQDLAPRFAGDPAFNGPDQPVVGVDWFDAWAYARWAGKQLPTEAQWERAASWVAEEDKKLPYPWGAKAPTERLCNFGGKAGRTLPVGRLAAGGSPVKGHDMAGNAAEWCRDWYLPDFYKKPGASGLDPVADQGGRLRAVRGGSWLDPPEKLRGAARRGFFPSGGVFEKPLRALGFRCVLGQDGG
jgi:formylglycine-generating enzyme required for sulfatase activity